MNHKPSLSNAQIDRILSPLGKTVSTEPLSGGMFASAYLVTFDDETKVVLKATGIDPRRLCRYERGIPKTEALTYRMLAENSIEVPELLLVDFSHQVADADVVVTRYFSNTPWIERVQDEEQQATTERQLGALMARLHRVSAPAFGYPALEAKMQADNWPTAFMAMVEGCVDDAADTDTKIPVDRIRTALEKHGDALAIVKEPKIVHNDLWPANIFVDDDNQIVGIIDPERTVWGDPLLDLIGADQLGLWEVNQNLLEGNTCAGGVLQNELASETGPARFALYRLYYSLILVTEIDVRGYVGPGVAEHRKRVEELLESTLDRLDSLVAV